MTPALYRDQIIGRDWLSQSPTAILGDVPGLGKSAQAITAALQLGAQRVLIACPAVARLNWERELVKWGWPWPITRVTGKADHRRPTLHTPQAVIASYDGLATSPALRGQLNSGLWDVLVLDEAHRLKNPTSRRTMATYGRYVDGRRCLVDKALNTWLLSGSIMVNSGVELWTHLRALWPGLICDTSGQPMDYYQFCERYFHLAPGEYAPRVMGYRDLDGLRALLDGIMLRRTWIEGLPPIEIREDPYLLDITSDQLAVLERDYADEWDDLATVLEAALGRAEGLDGLEDEWLHLATLRRLTGMLKADAGTDVVLQETPQDAKAILFCQHTPVIDRVMARLREAGQAPAMIDGRVTDAARNREIDRFQQDPRCRFLVGQYQACQEAINLTAASYIWSYEYTWSQEHLNQAFRRAWRRGQRNTCFVRFLAVAGSIDERLASLVARKARQLALLMQSPDEVSPHVGHREQQVRL